MGNVGHSKSLPGTPNFWNHGPAVTYKQIFKKRPGCRSKEVQRNCESNSPRPFPHIFYEVESEPFGESKQFIHIINMVDNQ